jgi:hypothetical protein
MEYWKREWISKKESTYCNKCQEYSKAGIA